MGKKQKAKDIIELLAYITDCLLLTAAVILAVGVLARTIIAETDNQTRIDYHMFVAIGFASFLPLLVIPRIRHNIRWMMTFTHEVTHMIFAALFMRKMNRLNVSEKDSHISYSDGWFGYIPITLSPYCIPIFTLVMLPWRLTTRPSDDPYLAVIDFLIGMTFAFHVCCWACQTRYSQTDITGPGKIRSTLFIVFFWLMDLSIVLLTPGSGVLLAFKRAFWLYPGEVITTIVSLF